MKLLVNVLAATNITQEIVEVQTEDDFPDDKTILEAVSKLFTVQVGITPIQQDVYIKQVRRKEAFTTDTTFYPADKTVIEVLVLKIWPSL